MNESGIYQELLNQALPKEMHAFRVKTAEKYLKFNFNVCWENKSRVVAYVDFDRDQAKILVFGKILAWGHREELYKGNLNISDPSFQSKLTKLLLLHKGLS